MVIVLVQTAPNAQLNVRISAANGHLVPHPRAKMQKGAHGLWRVIVSVPRTVKAGTERLTVMARLGCQ